MRFGSHQAASDFLFTSIPIYAVPPVLMAAFAALVMSQAFGYMRERFAAEESSGRGPKTVLAFDLASRGAVGVAIGLPTAELQAGSFGDSLTISDDSFAEMVLVLGLQLTLFLPCYVAIVWSSVLRFSGWVSVTVMFLIGRFAITNAMYWDPFLIYAGATLLVVSVPRRVDARSGPPAVVPRDALSSTAAAHGSAGTVGVVPIR
jgi:hypothetical protein